MVLESDTYIDISPYHEILSGMNFILSISVGVVKLTGPAGTGKTRLLQQLEAELASERQETLLFLTPPSSIKDLHDNITSRLKLDNEFGFNKALIHHIIAKPYDQQRLVVVFDNAELIDIDVLLAIALFRNIMHNNQPIVSIVLCGNEALNAKLEDSSYRPLVQDLLLSYELNPLTREQLQAYGNACADIHRLGKLPLKNGVLTELLNESKGLPGPVPELLKKLKDKVASGGIGAKVDEAPALVPKVATRVAAPEPAPVAKPAKSPFRLFGKKAAEPAVEAAPIPKPAPAAQPAPPPQAEPAPKPVLVAKPEPKPVPVAAPKPVQVAAPKPAPAAQPAPVPKPEPKPAPAARPEPAPALEVAASASLSPDERLILASRAEKEAAQVRKFKVNVDWQRWRPALQRSAMAAVLLVAIVVGWPYLAPTIGNLYTSFTTEEPVPAAPPAEQPAPPAEIAVTEQPEPVVAEPLPETPAPAAAAPEVVAVAPAEPVAEPAPPPAEAQVAVAVPEPAVVEPEPAPQIAVTEPPPAAPAQTAPPVTRIPGPTVTDASSAELEGVIREWLMAWQDQDIDDFFSYYHTDFAPLYQNTLADWRADRQNKISRPASIMIELEDLMIGSSSRIGTRVSFWMTYESPNYADRTLKEVLIGQDLDGQWRILQEYNQQTAPLAGTALAGTALAAAPAAPAPQSGQRTQIAANPLPQNAFPTPVQPPPVATRAALSQDQIDGIARFLAEWLTAWQNQDVDDYFRHYEPAYKPDFMASTEQWRNDRITKIRRPQRIVLRMDQLEIVAGDAENVRVQLVLEYHSTHYADRTVKEIELRKASSGNWLIAQEKNREVVPLPLMRLLPVDSLAYLVMR